MTPPAGPASRHGQPKAPGIGWVPYLAASAAGLTLALTWIGPRAADGLGTLNALAFWTAHVVPAVALLAATQATLSRIGAVAALRPVAQVVIAAVVGAMLFTPVALAVDVVFAAGGSADGDAEPLPSRLASEFAQFVVPVVLAWILINASSLSELERVPADAEPDVPTPVTAAAAPPADEFWSRLPRRLGRDLVSLAAELHYTRVRTTRGEALILFPFGRAVALLDGRDGFRIHRSHWVSLDHVDAVETRSGRTCCRLVDGTVLPVSRSSRAALKAAIRPAGARVPEPVRPLP